MFEIDRHMTSNLKEGAEKGTYQHPEFYGHSPERGMNYHPPIQKTIKSSKK